jgi:hypothetical protein
MQSFSAAVLITSICLATVLSMHAEDLSLVSTGVNGYSKRVHRFWAEYASVAQQSPHSIAEIGSYSVRNTFSFVIDRNGE